MTNGVNVRELILDVLLEITKNGEYSHIAIKNTLDKYQYLEKQERSFLTRVCEGTLENMILIDYVINQFSKVKVNKMKPVIRCILRSSVYELKFMDSVPVSATCNEAVKLAQKKGFHNLKGFVNGVLRNISRNLEQISMPDEEREPEKWLSVKYSIPEWLIEKWQKQYDKTQLEEMFQAFLEKSATSIRVNTEKTTKEELIKELEAEQITVMENEEVPNALYIDGYDFLSGITAFQEGMFYVQDVSSMLVSLWAEPKEGAQVIDVCAAPGGKSIHMAELLHGTGMVEARDLTEYKVSLIEENIERCGLTNIRAKQADARVLEEDSVGKADIVIADLPCSGLGVIGKKPDIKYKMSEAKCAELAALQREILHTVQNYVKSGGVFMYSTCTINPQENEENVQWFLKEHADFELERQQQILPKKGKNDGFFLARMVRK
ncbi:16S rRNA (cytosine(967)-C(5))-methyltransferase RsmB [Roseburia sp. MSJ-14]|uniref:16S rRNA (cytosine(967)-C(5))-methyltransferase RsmB n=1 Tax=Roseburia sp. MSJ-14 TaxID=2841514 RepID=UPI00095DCCE7|nr:16S rRNA (cytosine(967)-C(5))-methyltransferase RsmB [Roseburia sp. MSJ-14]MBU5473916.1 16S rRNA (cytosine(967)-C(5))-methyltransferase RsmB [Roseburia sp. MSJ-14]OKZ67374.1 MAG: 16S rRNA (cytosine(967)-C(5))-methyltransferase [Clostridiales bacterium 41_12_two_minus]